ncbi:hypothetical protein [Piscirickettsia litoralis]|uniref:Uncharacterized protein n=1 Tax=Piscirickettsia litoralis TaxID=1891921 RepID=A0ABX3A7R4_9GAMM|nr:hypothetical protein [Piscirickettsia litoralis]ODN43673.1 hypothetical protein BGC07_13135 [Piscirickettsia litoralis]
MKYSQIFKKAFENYTKMAIRPGYTAGRFASIRHGKKMYPHIKNLQDKLSNPQSNPKQLLDDYFKSDDTKLNNHSFAMYLIDALEAHDPKENWGKYYPQGKKVVFYSGKLYLGTMQSPEDAFTNGMSANSTPTLEPYISGTSKGTGLSTSKSKQVAESDSQEIIPMIGMPLEEPMVKNGYTYKINYRGSGGVDIVGTHKARSNSRVLSTACKFKQEVNIIGKVEARDIVGCWDHKGEWMANPNYQPNFAIKQPETFSARRALIFIDAVGKDKDLPKSKEIEMQSL